MKLFLGVYLVLNLLSVTVSIFRIHENIYPRLEERTIKYDLWCIIGGLAFCFWAGLIYWGVIK